MWENYHFLLLNVLFWVKFVWKHTLNCGLHELRYTCISPRDLFIMTLFQFACGCRGEKPQVLRAALLLQATRPRLLRMHKEAINYIFQFDSLCTKHLRPNVNWAHFSAAQFSPKPRTIHFPRFLCLLHAGMQVFRVYLHNSTYYLHCYTALLAPKSFKDPSLFPTW